MASDAQSLTNLAATEGYAKLSQRAIFECILTAIGKVAGSGQVLQYTVDPTTEGKVPADQNQPAISYQVNNIAKAFYWNTTTHTWM